MLMPPIVISRRTRSSPRQAVAIAASAAVSSCSMASSPASHRSTAARSCADSGCSASHFRPGPRNSLPENGGIRFACSTAWMRFLVRVMPCTIAARRETRLRSSSVASSGCHTSGRYPAACSRASAAASIRSVLAFASAITRTCNGFAMTTRPTCGFSSFTIAIVLPVASSTTSSSALSVRANASTLSRTRSTRPHCRRTPSSSSATWAKLRCTSNPITLIVLLPFSSGAGGATRHLRIRARSATGLVAGAANY